MNRVGGEKRGMALLVTIALLTLMIAVAVELHQRARAAVISSAVSRDRIYLSEMAYSGIQAAMAILTKDKMASAVDTIQEDWADPEKVKDILNEFAYDEGTLVVDIQDEIGRIQVNALVSGPGGREFNELQRLVWERFLEWFKGQYQDAAIEIDSATIINSLKDWMDSGDDDAITGLTGAESEFYQDLNPPYPCRNAPIKHVDELLRIKGVTEILLDGSDTVKGLSDFLTVYGAGAAVEDAPDGYTTGRVNINTAPLPVLVALLPEENSEVAQLMVEYREERDGTNYVNDISSPTWYKGVPGIGDIEFDSALITTTSDLFRITAAAAVGERKLTMQAVVRREQHESSGKWMCRVLRLSTQ